MDIPDLQSAELHQSLLPWADCTIIITHHITYDHGWMVAHANLIVDRRNATRDVTQHCAKSPKL